MLKVSRIMLILALVISVCAIGNVVAGGNVGGKPILQEELPADVAHMQAAVKAITPYIYQNKNKEVLLDISGAEEAGVPEEFIETGQELVALSNAVVGRKRL